MSKNYKCLIVDEMHESVISLLHKIDVTPIYKPDISRDEIIQQLSDFEILFIRSKTKVDEELLTNAKNLKVVGRAGAGIDNLDEDHLNRIGVSILNAPEGNMDAVGEQTVGMLLSLLHNIVKSHKEVATKVWDREGNRGVELSGKTVGIIGYGNMGKAVAKRLHSFGCSVVAYDKYKVNYGDKCCKQVSLQQLFELSDVVTLHIPLTQETNKWIDDKFFNNFNKPIYFLNLSRGEIVSLTSLIKAIKTGKVLGAALDVLENEKLATMSLEQKDNFEFLSTADNVIMTPHIGGWSQESYFKINQVLVEKLKQTLNAR